MSMEQVPTGQADTEAVGNRFFDVEFDADSIVKPVDVNPVSGGLFISDFHSQYHDLMPNPTATLGSLGVNERGELFDKADLRLNQESGWYLQQTVMLGLAWPRPHENHVSWQVKVVDNVNGPHGRQNRLHVLFQSPVGEWRGITRHHDNQLRETHIESMGQESLANLYRAVRFLLTKSDVEEQAKILRQRKEVAKTRIIEISKPKRSGKPLSVNDILLLADLKQIGFTSVPWRQPEQPQD